MKEKTGNTFKLPERYEVLRTLGAGGMGTVLLARDLKLKRNVAIKVIKKEIISDPKMLSRTKLEGLILSKLRHPSLASVYEMDMDSEFPYIVQQYIEGESIADQIDSGRLLPPRKATRLLKEQAEVLGYLHEQNIFHRDIKPDNIMIDHSGKSVLMDFGLALAGDRTRFTEEGNFVGTLLYCAPEVLKGWDGGARADIFQLGLVIHEAITGKSLYGEFDTIEEFLQVISSGSWEKAPLSRKIPQKLAGILRRVCTIDPEERPANGCELLSIIDSETGKSSKPLSSQRSRTGRNSSINSTGKMEAVKTDEKPKAASLRKKLATGAMLLSVALLLFFGLSLVSDKTVNSNYPDSELATNTSSILGSSRAFIVTPKGFYLFLPSNSGKNLQWTLKFEDSEIEEYSDRFTKVAGGWKTLLRKKNLPQQSPGTLSIYDNDTLIAQKHLKFPDTYFSKPLQATFFHDHIQATWEFYGKAPATIVVYGYKDNGQREENPLLTKDTDTGKCSILLSELGEKRDVSLSLYIPDLGATTKSSTVPPPETKVGEARGACELNVEFQLATQHPSKGNTLSQLKNFGDNNLLYVIKKMASFKDRVYLTTASGHVHCLKVTPYSQPMFQTLWRHDFREIPEFAKAPLSGKVYYLVPRSMNATADGVEILGLGKGLKIHSYDLTGNHSEQKTPKLAMPLPKAGSALGTILAKTASLGKRTLFLWHLDGKKYLFFVPKTAKPTDTIKPVSIPYKQWEYVDAFSGLGTTFLVISNRSNHILYYLDEGLEDLKKIDRFPIDEGAAMRCSGAFYDKEQIGLITRNSDLIVIRKEGAEYSYERIIPKLPENPSISGITYDNKGSFISIVTSSDMTDSLVGSSLTKLHTLRATVSKSGKLTTKLQPLKASAIYELLKCRVLGPVMIGKDQFCFTAGMGFFIISGDRAVPAYRKSLLQSPDILLKENNYVLTSKFYDGNLFALPLSNSTETKDTR